MKPFGLPERLKEMRAQKLEGIRIEISVVTFVLVLWFRCFFEGEHCGFSVKSYQNYRN
jgi:hypothetical protein